MDEIIKKLTAYKPFHALVIGDYMLDQYIRGAAERLSPDAPVPVLKAEQTEDRPGGAANVCLDIVALGGKVTVLGVAGDDTEGQLLRKAMEKAGCDTRGLIVDPDRPTTVKRSLIGLAQHRHPQKMFRVDIESSEAISPSVLQEMLKVYEQILPEVDIVCIEDYNKGVCSALLCREIMQRARAMGKQVLVDPAAVDDYGRYHGATAITPNRSEAELATGMDTVEDAGDAENEELASMLLHTLDLDAVILTLDRSGALVLERDGSAVPVATVAREVYDVTGAGDMVLAALAAARSQGWDWRDSVVFANVAAGLEVAVFGVEPIPLVNVKRELLTQHHPLPGKVRTLEELLIELDVHRQSGKSIVLTNGCFDVIHAGHVAYLREAKNQGDILVVGVNSDEQVTIQKGAGRPVYNINDRLEILSELQCVDYLIEFNEPTAHELLRNIKPHIYIKGGDYRPEDINEWDLLKEWIAEGRIELKVLAHRPGLGSTQTIEKLNNAGNK